MAVSWLGMSIMVHAMMQQQHHNFLVLILRLQGMMNLD